MPTVTLRPNADIQLQHSPSSGSVGYSMINSTAQSDNTYIEQGLVKNADLATLKSFFSVSANETQKIYLTGISGTIRSRYYSNRSASETPTVKHGFGITINGGTETSTMESNNLSTSWRNYTSSVSPDGLNKIYTNINAANIQLSISTQGQYSYTGSKSITVDIRTSWAYVTATYENVWDCLAYAKAGTGISAVNVSETEVINGNNVTYSANLQNGYRFVGWYSDENCTRLVSSDQTYSFKPTASTTLYAKGAYIYHINVFADDNCTVVAQPSSGIAGETTTVTASHTNKYLFAGWYSNPSRTSLVTTENPYTFNINADVTLYAKTKLNEIMYVKIDNVWYECSAVYKKINDVWVEQMPLDDVFDKDKNYKIEEI